MTIVFKMIQLLYYYLYLFLFFINKLIYIFLFNLRNAAINKFPLNCVIDFNRKSQKNQALYNKKKSTAKTD